MVAHISCQLCYQFYHFYFSNFLIKTNKQTFDKEEFQQFPHVVLGQLMTSFPVKLVPSEMPIG